MKLLRNIIGTILEFLLGIIIVNFIFSTNLIEAYLFGGISTLLPTLTSNFYLFIYVLLLLSATILADSTTNLKMPNAILIIRGLIGFLIVGSVAFFLLPNVEGASIPPFVGLLIQFGFSLVLSLTDNTDKNKN